MFLLAFAKFILQHTEHLNVCESYRQKQCLSVFKHCKMGKASLVVWSVSQSIRWTVYCFGHKCEHMQREHIAALALCDFCKKKIVLHPSPKRK